MDGREEVARRATMDTTATKGVEAMRSDIVPGGVFPDYELADHTTTMRRLSELQGDDPLILTLARGPLLPQGASTASAAGRVLSADRRRVHADRDDIDR
jgi:hypothetical protein